MGQHFPAQTRERNPKDFAALCTEIVEEFAKAFTSGIEGEIMTCLAIRGVRVRLRRDHLLAVNATLTPFIGKTM